MPKKTPHFPDALPAIPPDADETREMTQDLVRKNGVGSGAGEPRSLLTDFSALVGSIGDRSFSKNVLLFTNRVCGASLASVFHMRCASAAPIASMSPASLDGSNAAHLMACRYLEGKAWLQDPALRQVRRCIGDGHGSIFRTDMARSGGADFCNTIYGEGVIADRLLVYCKIDDDIFGIGLLRAAHSGRFSQDDVRRVEDILEPLLAASRRHLSLTGSSVDVSAALTSLEDIVDCIAHSPVTFPRREAQVCARIIHGISTGGIAREFEISDETVLTYRKRIYSRLGISTQRELLLWYLRIWSIWGKRSLNVPAVH